MNTLSNLIAQHEVFLEYNQALFFKVCLYSTKFASKTLEELAALKTSSDKETWRFAQAELSLRKQNPFLDFHRFFITLTLNDVEKIKKNLPTWRGQHCKRENYIYGLILTDVLDYHLALSPKIDVDLLDEILSSYKHNLRFFQHTTREISDTNMIDFVNELLK